VADKIGDWRYISSPQAGCQSDLKLVIKQCPLMGHNRTHAMQQSG
jgi:hypothetical protein